MSPSVTSSTGTLSRKAFKNHREQPQTPSPQRITSLDLETGELKTVGHTISEPLLLSVGACWNDIVKMEYHHVQQIDMSSTVHQEHAVIYHCSPVPAAIEHGVNGHYSHRLLQPDDLTLFPKGTTTWARSPAEMEFLVLTINSTFIDRIAQELMPGSSVELNSLPAFQDAQLQYLLLTFKAELEAGCPGERLFGESLATALAVQLLKKYAATPGALHEYKSGLPKNKLKQAIAYINEHLGEDVSLEAISTEVGISQYYFARMFKQSMGMSPHKYVNQQRIERAKQLLKDSRAAISEIASQLGYVDQSHLNRHFRQLTGITPKVYRDKL